SMNNRGTPTLLAMLATAFVSAPASTWANAAPPGPARIAIKDFMFAPTSLKINTGTAVMWINNDDEPHTIVSETGLFRSGGVDTNETFMYTFEKRSEERRVGKECRSRWSPY